LIGTLTRSVSVEPLMERFSIVAAETLSGRHGTQRRAMARLDVALSPARSAIRHGCRRAESPDACAGPGTTLQRITITGAGSGIGAATMAELERRGARAIGLDLVAERPRLLACDVRVQESVDRAVSEATERLGGLDVLINCAGLATPQSAGEAPDERALAVIDVNMLGPWCVTSAALPALRSAGGRVVNVASMAFVAMPFAPAYAMSKHGVVVYSQALRLEHGDAISVTTVYPGYIRTPITKTRSSPALPGGQLAGGERRGCRRCARTRSARRSTCPGHVTTRTGRFTVALSRFAPRRFVDQVLLRQMRKGMKGRNFDDASAPLLAFAERRGRASPGPKP
jgi:NAD(P)-dependent dehydrogenase (short-subunit alcohol dehydrogenase family)